MSQLINTDAMYLISKAINNSKNFIYEFEQFKSGRNFSILSKTNPNLFEQLINEYNKYILSNGLFVRKFLQFPLNEYYSFVFNILTRKTNKYKNNWYNYIQNHIFDNYENDITSIKLESLEDMYGYYSDMLPRLIKKHCKTINQNNYQTKPHDVNIKLIDEFVKIGECCKYDVKGFYDNELLYLLCGICIVDGINRITNKKINSFTELFNFVKSYLQLWQLNKVFYHAKISPDNETNLVTHIKSNGNYVKRYKNCLKYFTDYNQTKNKTKYVIDEVEDKIYIQTNINPGECEDLLKTLDKLYLDSKFVDIYYLYITNQILTRSSCLSALIILNILSYINTKQFIKINPNEQLDWFAISCDIGKFRTEFNTKTTEVNIELAQELIDLKPMTVGDVLYYTHNYIAIQLNK